MLMRAVLSAVVALSVASTGWAQTVPEPAVTPAASPAAEPDAPKWDVQNPPGPSHDAAIDVTEGTWMALDVSPDGREIVFDLLGDIYVMPIEGGEARAIASGVAWDMQPKYSPDGTKIAFTSDRDGGDNIWVMNRDGSNPTQVSDESFRLLNSPDWSPDGEFIVARKHFTGTRSLGSGEMWLYHRSGGGGVQLTTRRTPQKDSGEPAFSPDGRYLYFSDDNTPGDTFEYSKDVNGEIYVIQRLDRESGRIEEFLGGPGGSIRPTPSPDGRSLAFIRRVRYQSTLYVMDIESGRETAIYSGLDRDLQETWAVHGVYPAMSWTPDNRSIVFWAGGKIQRIDVASQAVTDIPFRVSDTRRIQEAVRFPVEVAPDTFDVKMIRWARTSPDGSRVVYEALGNLWVRDLPNGTPRRLTRQSDHFELYPNWSRDGRSIVYTTWDDEDLGTLRVVPAAGGEGRVISRNPGHYIEPTFSPDGRTVVYRTVADGFLTSGLWGRQPGIYRVPTAGGEPALVSRSGSAPQFGASNDRIYFTGREDGKSALKSVDLNGQDGRTHLLSEWAAEYVLSPDEHWIAWTERFNAYVAPFVRTGRPVTLSTDGKALPQTRFTRDAGEWLHWAGDSSRLSWSLGPQLFHRDLNEGFAFVEGAPTELPKPPETGINIGFQQAADRPEGRLALTGARIVTMDGDRVIEDGVIIAMEFPVHPIQETGKRPTAGLDRNLAYLGLVELLYGYPLDGVVLTIGCDKTTPACLLAAATVNMPAIALSVGPMLNGWHKGERVGSGSIIWKAREMMAAGELDYEGFIDLVATSAPSVGYCNTMGTASTMNTLTEALGMSLPGSAAIPAPYRERPQVAYQTGLRIVEMVKDDLKPSDILTRKAFENAIVVNSAIGGSTNAPIHLTALARHVGVDLPLQDWQTVGHKVPLLVNLQPAGTYLGEDFHQAGGAPAVIAELMRHDLIHEDALTVNGRTIGENSARAEIVLPDVIRTFETALVKDAGFLVMTGNIFETAIMKTSVISADFRARYLSNPDAPEVLNGIVTVFDGPEDYHHRIDDPTEAITAESVLVMRGSGPVGHPGAAEVVNMRPPSYLIKQGIMELPCVGDGRQSGTSGSPSILNASPEAATGGNIALLKNGDRIRIDLARARVDVDLTEDELAARRRALEEAGGYRYPASQTPWQEIQRGLVGELQTGAVLEGATRFHRIIDTLGLPRDNH